MPHRQERPPADTRRAKLTAALALTFLFGAQLWAGLRPLADLDVWWHIRLGEQMVTTGTLVPTEPFSFTRAGVDWPWKDWGTALMLYGTWAVAGVAGLVVLKASFLVGTAAVMWRWLRRELQVPMSLAVLCCAVCLDAASYRFTERGATVSLLIVIVVAWLIETHRHGKATLLWVVPLVVLNANIHRGVLLLPLLLGALAVVEVFESRVLGRERAYKRSAAVAVLCALGCLATPFGWRIITTTIALMGQHSALITEWAPLEVGLVWRLTPGTYFATALVVVGGTASVIKRRDPWHLVLVVLALGLGSQSIRHLPYVALLGVGPAAAGLAALSPTTWNGSLRNVIAVAAGSLALVAQVGHPLPAPSLGLAQAHYPEKGVQFIQEHELKGPMFNDFGYGGFLIFELWPKHHVYIDGRTDLVYPAKMVEDYVAALHDPAAFAAQQRAWGLEWVIIDNAPPLGTLAHLDTDPRWALVHASRRALIYVRRDGVNRDLAEALAYRWLWPHALQKSLIHAQRKGHLPQAVRELQRMVAEDPDNLYARAAQAWLSTQQREQVTAPKSEQSP